MKNKSMIQDNIQKIIPRLVTSISKNPVKEVSRKSTHKIIFKISSSPIAKHDKHKTVSQKYRKIGAYVTAT